MKRLLKYTAIFLMVLMSGSSVWAYTYNEHITTAPNNKGDVLVYPWYLALDGGWYTKLTVINTDAYACVVAKVVIRSFKNSEELLDFLIYLSPSDVWTGVLKYLGGKVIIYSDDDSAVYSESPLVFASTTPISQPMFGLDCADDGDFAGYVEVIMAAYKTMASTAAVAKSKIFYGYKGVAAGDTSIGPMTLPSVGTNPNCLAGYMELQNLTLGLSSSLRATALKDNDTNAALTTGPETALGSYSNNTLAEIEAALTKNNIGMPYVNGSNTALHFFTFPTKLTQRGIGCEDNSVLSPFFKQHSTAASQAGKSRDWCVEYLIGVYDLKENTPQSGPFSGGGTTYEFCNEVNWIATSSFPYTEGWARYVISAGTNTLGYTKKSVESSEPLYYNGAPVIPSYLYLGTLGIEMNYGAWTDTPVAGALSPYCYDLVDYQYTDSAVVTVKCPT